jgi:predicted HNH restriction endonuclease
MVRDGYYFLSKRLGRSDFGEVILEEYGGKWCYYGIYDLTIRTDATNVNPHLVQRAAAFFESVARTRPAARLESESHAVYPQIENRKIVMSHIQRERSSYLATMRKIHDNYQCQVCGLRFEDAYGAIGKEFAECHHRKPLHQLEGEVTTELKDLATVCANCHRMLHRMTGDFDDVSKLRQVVRRHS